MTARNGSAEEMTTKSALNGREKISSNSCEMVKDRRPIENSDDDEVIVID
jgi:hypothetical protein